MYNILILGVSGNVSQGILKAIRASSINCKIIGACVNTDTVGALWCDEFYQSPFANSDSFIPWVIDLCEKMNIDILLTGVEENLLALSEKINIINSSVKTKVIVSDYDKLLIGQNKLFTCQWLKEHEFNYPLYAVAADIDAVGKLVAQAGFPLIAKPVNGKGSHGIFVLNNETDIEKVHAFDNYIIQQCVGTLESEYTVGCYYDKNGNSVEPIVMQRWLNNGSTWKAKVIDYEIIKAECKKICDEFKPMGPMNIQLRLDDNNCPVPFEFNVRFSGTTPIRSQFGFRDVEAAIYEYLNESPINAFFNVKTGTAYRYINEVYKFSDNDNMLIDKTLER